MNFFKMNENTAWGKVEMRRGCIECGTEDLFGETAEVDDDGGASSDGGSNK